jgi:hypothetical protein
LDGNKKIISPAKAGAQVCETIEHTPWIPAFAGMTRLR